MRLLGALPDALTAGFFMVLWVAPQLLWPQALRTGLLMMLVEFILVHAAGMLGGIVLAREGQAGGRWKPILGFGAFYLVFIADWAGQFQAWWPLLALGWLLAGKLALVLQPLPSADKRHQLASDWAIGVMAYLAGVFLTTFLPLPRLGLDRAIVAAADLPGDGGHGLAATGGAAARRPGQISPVSAWAAGGRGVRRWPWPRPGSRRRGCPPCSRDGCSQTAACLRHRR